MAWLVIILAGTQPDNKLGRIANSVPLAVGLFLADKSCTE